MRPFLNSEVTRGRLRPIIAEVILTPIYGTQMTSPGLGMSKMTSASGGLKRPRIFNEAVQPRGWNKNFAKSDFMHSPKIWAKSDYWNSSKPHFFDQYLHHLWRPFRPQIWPLHTFCNWIWKFMSKLISRQQAESIWSVGTLFLWRSKTGLKVKKSYFEPP